VSPQNPYRYRTDKLPHMRFCLSALVFLILLLPFQGQVGARGPEMEFGGPREGERAPNFRLQTLDGKSASLSEHLGKRPIVIETGSYTCPVFRGTHRSMESLYSKFKDQAAFFVLYTTEAHPEGDPSPYTGEEWVTQDNERKGVLHRQPKTMSDRKRLAAQAKSDLGITVPIVLDDMRNSAWKSYGQAPNAAYLIGKDGKVKLRQSWFKAGAFKKALVGELQ
jgi:hypothetical protein